MTIMLCGDPHGAEHIFEAQAFAKDQGCNDVVFLGDIYDRDRDYPDGPKVWTLPGNHEKPGPISMPLDGFGNHEVLPRDGWRGHIGPHDMGVIGGIDYESHEHLEREMVWLYRVIMSSGEDVACFDKESVEYHVQTWAEDPPDILLTHDAPFPFYLRHNERAGSQYLTNVIHRLQPRYHFGGHMHWFSDKTIGDTRSIQLSDLTGLGVAQDYAILEDDGDVTLGEMGIGTMGPGV